MPATNQQVQAYVDQRIRPHSRDVLVTFLKLVEDKSVIGDVYANVNDGGSTWTDTRTDGPPHLILRTDVLAWNTFVTELIEFIEEHAQWPVVQNCVFGPLDVR